MVEKKLILQQAKKCDSFYLYEQKDIIAKANQLVKDFPGVKFLYSVKANPCKKIIKTLVEQKFWSDAASLKEVLISRKCGLKAKEIYYSVPGKTKYDIKNALGKCVIIADSLNEIFKINDAASEKGVVAEIGVRINPNFTFEDNSYKASKFGIDETLFFLSMIKLEKLKNIKIIGLHVHLRCQELHHKVLSCYYEKVFLLANKFQLICNNKLKFINLGSGLGTQYSSSDQPLDTAALGLATKEIMHNFQKRNPKVLILIETGRFVVNQAGTYITKVLDKKVSFGKTFVILANTLNGFVRPSLARLVENYTNAKTIEPTEPLYTSRNCFEFIVLNDSKQKEQVTLVGNLCTSADVIAQDILLPALKIDDVIAITNAGSYAFVLSPMQFSSLEPPKQFMLKTDGGIIEV